MISDIIFIIIFIITTSKAVSNAVSSAGRGVRHKAEEVKSGVMDGQIWSRLMSGLRI